MFPEISCERIRRTVFPVKPCTSTRVSLSAVRYVLAKLTDEDVVDSILIAGAGRSRRESPNGAWHQRSDRDNSRAALVAERRVRSMVKYGCKVKRRC